MTRVSEDINAVTAVTPKTFSTPYGLQWIVILVFGLSSALNYLDRQFLAAVAPSVKAEFQLSNAEYGLLISAFSITYMVIGPFAGWFLDRVGLRVGAVISVAAWSAFGRLTGFAQSFSALFATRMGLGMAESAGIPSSSKASSTHLIPAEVGLGNAVQSLDVTIGMILAPPSWRRSHPLTDGAPLLSFAVSLDFSGFQCG